MKQVIIASYLNSGSILHLLRDILDYPICEGNFKLTTGRYSRVIPLPHMLNWQFLDNHHRVIFLVRDPRTICIHGANQLDCTVNSYLKKMVEGKVMHLGRWDDYITEWLELVEGIHSDLFHLVRYEDLTLKTTAGLSDILKFTQAGYCLDRIKPAIINHKFDNQVKWYNYFTKDMNDLTIEEFGEVMERLGYIR